MNEDKPTLIARAGQSRDRTWRDRRMGHNLLLSQADIALLNALKPRCAVCNKPVDVFEWERDANLLHITFRAYCHGAIEESQIALANMHIIMGGGVQGGVAFDDPQLPAPQ